MTQIQITHLSNESERIKTAVINLVREEEF